MSIISPLPNTLTNGTTADATQVMADLNQIVNNVNANAAANGANSDITSLSGLSTPLSVSQGGTGVTTPNAVNRNGYASAADVQDNTLQNLTSVAGTNTITATAAISMSAYASGQQFSFIPAASNTGATTININSLGAKNIFLNGAALVGYELRKNCPVMLLYDGTQFNIIAGAHGGDGIPLGASTERYFATAPNGHLLCDGSAVSRTTYADLFAVLSTTWGAGDGSTTFNLPSMARKVSVGSGGTGTSTLANTVGSTGGEETHTLTSAEMPVHNHSASSSASASGNTYANDSSNTGITGVGAPSQVVGTGASVPVYNLSVSVSTSIGNSGSGGAHNNMQPSIVVYKCIKY